MNWDCSVAKTDSGHKTPPNAFGHACLAPISVCFVSVSEKPVNSVVPHLRGSLVV
jgi:hypothetical protein